MAQSGSMLERSSPCTAVSTGAQRTRARAWPLYNERCGVNCYVTWWVLLCKA